MVNKDIKDILTQIDNDVPNGICCCCGHTLNSHIDENEGWRCHSLAQDFYQCECYLRKNKGLNIDHDKIGNYDLKKRIKRYLKEENLTVRGAENR